MRFPRSFRPQHLFFDVLFLVFFAGSLCLQIMLKLLVLLLRGEPIVNGPAIPFSVGVPLGHRSAVIQSFVRNRGRVAVLEQCRQIGLNVIVIRSLNIQKLLNRIDPAIALDSSDEVLVITPAAMSGVIQFIPIGICFADIATRSIFAGLTLSGPRFGG